MIADLILKYNQLVPRYTSYPTAPHFKTEFDTNIYANWLSNLEKQPVSLYIHIPFCHKLCWFCGCNTKITQKYFPIKRYLKSLLKEVSLISNLLSHKIAISQIHFGGGSPNILDADDFATLFTSLGEKFTILPDAEIAMEVDPRHIEEKQIAIYSQYGVNRISIGVQDFHLNTQQAINRVQPYEIIKDTMDLLRNYNINNINLDLIYGLPHQTIVSMQKNIDLALSLDPNRLSIFGYAHVPWMKKHMRLIKEEDLPNDLERIKIFQTITKQLNKNNYNSIGIDHFAKQDDQMSIAYNKKLLRRNFQGYVTDNAPTIIALGGSAIGYIKDKGYIQNNSTTNIYQELVDNEKLATNKGIVMSEIDLLHYDIIMELMCYLEIDLKNIAKKHHKELTYFDPYLQKLENFVTDEILTINDYHLKINPQAKQLTRIICSYFDSYFMQRKANHSKTV